MRLTVNGEMGDYADGLTVADLLRERGHDPAVVVVERNGQIVPAADFAATSLCADDVLELVQFVGGG
ncbi:sulfur carrier protein ThiS [uncultured Desulfovibrio sp.]|uniref:Sulfur carrier protein ThiS n=1 Tax=Candidatus Desulfovibrio intestinavium TaxID=2838534 RepID=A0A9D2KPT5_9BACT|nr:sulfur carrier protein ThiS [uncultured Desulfovibrio sp.]HJA79107.1 sulfur carrier protein ThiS [Candidatus Desulfovibrio intestinavium]